MSADDLIAIATAVVALATNVIILILLWRHLRSEEPHHD